jgi:hypothetical protein
MDLKPGDTLGPREIVSATGKGGIGQVLRSQDAGASMDGNSRDMPISVGTKPDPEPLTLYPQDRTARLKT